jgi:hypothetical protein
MNTDGRDTQTRRDVLRSAVIADKERTARHECRQVTKAYTPDQ